MKDDRLYLIHIRDTIARVQRFTKGGKEEFFASELIQGATLYSLQILTESTQRLSDNFKNAYPDLNWQGMAGFRNVIVHGYLSIDLQKVWDVVEKELPLLRDRLQEVFDALPTKPAD